MLKPFYFLPVCLLYSFAVPAQENPVRYRDLLFKEVNITKDIVYGKPPQASIKSKYYLLDLYQPAGDAATKRPLIIWLHGGGFKLGNKSSRGLPLWSKDFAKRGYVCASVNYRNSRGKTLSQFEATTAACSDAIEDLYQAISFLKQHASMYGIDTSLIILGGNSAGGMIALQAAYSSFSDLHALTKRGPDPAISSAVNPLHIKAVINLWGALFNLDYLKQAQVPIVSVHGVEDRVVPFGHLKALYGSYVIHQAADSLHLPNQLLAYEGLGHELQKHFIPFYAGAAVKKRWKASGNFAAAFLYLQLFARQ